MNPLQPRVSHQFDAFASHPELDDIDVGDFDWSDPSAFLNMMTPAGMAPPTMMQPADVRREAKEKSTQLFADFHLLRSILERHETTIQKRWTKKTRTQKLAILLAAWPSMPTTHRPDFAAFRKNAPGTSGLTPQLRGSYVWPYINQEDLLRSKTLLLLLKARGRNHPSVFAAADGDAMHIGMVSRAVVPIFLNEHVFMLNGITRDTDYGRLLGWDEHPDAFDWMSSRKQFLPGEGLLILEAQARVLAFLVACCRSILHEIPGEDLRNDALYPTQPEPVLKDSTATAGLAASLTVLAEEAPYRVPERLDLDKIEALLAARKEAAEGHVLALREDPGYFADHLNEMREHRQEMIKDVAGNVHPTLKPPRQGLLWCRVIGEVAVQAYFQLELYTELHKQAQHLRKLQRQYADKILPLEDLPEPYLAALLKFRHYLNQIAKGPMNQLKNTFAASPPMRSYFVREVPISADSSKISTMSRPGVKMDPIIGQLVWLLQTLWEDGQNLFLCRLPAVVDELDRLLTIEQRARELVSPYIASMISELSIVGECLRQIDIYQPWANGFQHALVDREDAIKRNFAEHTQSHARVLAALRDENIAAIRAYGDPSDNKFSYPVGKRRSKAVSDSLRSAEHHLDIFWAKADGLVRARAGNQDGSAMQRLLAQPRLLQRTPEWVEPPPKAPKEAGSGADALAGSLAAVHVHSGPPPSSSRKDVLAEAAARSAKAKAKTRGQARGQHVANTDDNDTDTGTQPPVPDVQPRIAVDARALKVLRILFFDPAANTTPGEVAWLDFLHALQATGFVAQKLYGSVWHFQPMTLDVERSIQFHEPHPRGKIPFATARRHGRRLNRAYGWHGGVFLLKEKAAGV
ncbi:hypothetical protein F503_08670 [Ophiostoma piceae UAMH 11346]|uniref:Uncharacterized protein n=1 Tax=Ophiostoma piceae (strain UAMH 11346) TaxID=1262450 RepID=S3BUE4_OPHP1|nr:hypothetical protein F503_08670 [Ophiostoma piceae UAMH 11346]